MKKSPEAAASRPPALPTISPRVEQAIDKRLKIDPYGIVHAAANELPKLDDETILAMGAYVEPQVGFLPSDPAERNRTMARFILSVAWQRENDRARANRKTLPH